MRLGGDRFDIGKHMYFGPRPFLAFLFIQVAFESAVLGQIKDPLPDISKGDLTVRIDLFARVGGARWMDMISDHGGGMHGVDQRGSIYEFESDGSPQRIFDIRNKSQLVSRGQQGLNGAAFHPQFHQAGTPGFGLMYTTSSQATSADTPPDFDSPDPQNSRINHHDSVIHEWDMNAAEAVPRELLRIRQPFNDHNVGQISFNPNAKSHDVDYGLLYIGSGDGGNNFPVSSFEKETDPFRNGQDLATPLGTILRIDPLGNDSANGKYGIPSDNPFANDNDTNTLGEIWAYGLRNPHRFAWDTGGDGKFLISDIGQNHVEEINLGMKGANYGWSEREGTFLTNHSDETEIMPLPVGDATLGYTYPVIQYDHDQGDRAISGGLVYRGSDPTLDGTYFFSDLTSGRIMYADVDDLTQNEQASFFEATLIDGATGEETTMLELYDSGRSDIRFGTNDFGDVFILTKQDGSIRKIAAVPEPSTSVLVTGAILLPSIRRRRVAS